LSKSLKFIKRVGFLALGGFIFPSILLSQSSPSKTFGSGVSFIASDSSFSLKFAARFQSLYTFTAPADRLNSPARTSEFLIRRARLKFDGFAVNPKLVYKLELGLSNRDIGSIVPETGSTSRIFLDAVLKWNFHKGFTLWAGQTKLPGNRERVISSGNMQFVDRSLVNGRFNIDRDVGFQLHHEHKLGKIVVREIASLSQGEGRNITVPNIGGYDYTGRLEVLPFGAFTKDGDYIGSDLEREKKPKLSLAASYDFNDGASRQRGQLGSFNKDSTGAYVLSNLTTIFLDAVFKYKGYSLSIEYANTKGTNINAISKFGKSVGYFYAGQGFVVQSGYLFKRNFEFALRYTNIQPNANINQKAITEYTLGFSRYIVGHKLKIQSDLSYQNIANTGNQLIYRMQFDIHF